MTRHQRSRPDEVGRLVQAVSRRLGLAFDGSHRRWMADAIDDWWHRAGPRSATEQLARLEHDPAAWDQLVDRLTIRETYFFRHHDQLQEISEVVVATASPPPGGCPRAPTGDGPVRVWSAGCASGEEPYSLAILLDRSGVLDQCRIVATDASRAAIEAARSATYGRWSRRGDVVDRHARYFRRHGDRVRLDPRIAHAVRFAQHNLLDGPPGGAAFDVIVCRNVLLHLQPEARQRAAGVLRAALRPGGWLFVAASDPVPAVDGLVPVPTEHGLAFHRRHTGPLLDPPTSGMPPGRPEPGATTAGPGSDRPARPRPRPRWAGDAASRTAPAARAAARRGPDPSLASSPRPDGPPGQGVDEPLDPARRCAAAVRHLQAGRVDDAVAEARAAVYLDRSLAMAHLLLGRAELGRGNPDRARRSFANALELLQALPPEAEVPLSDGTPARRLAATVRALATVGPR